MSPSDVQFEYIFVSVMAILYSHSLQGHTLYMTPYWNVCNLVSNHVKKGILNILDHIPLVALIKSAEMLLHLVPDIVVDVMVLIGYQLNSININILINYAFISILFPLQISHE